MNFLVKFTQKNSIYEKTFQYLNVNNKKSKNFLIVSWKDLRTLFKIKILFRLFKIQILKINKYQKKNTLLKNLKNE